MENLNNHREAMATALNTIDQLFNQLQVQAREKEIARERFAECNYWLARLYGRLEAEINAQAGAIQQAQKDEPIIIKKKKK